jgi:hypothetical protein
MNSSDSNPKLPTWLFIVADLALLGTAFFIASQSARPLSDRAMIAIVICVVFGTIVAFVPLVARFERQKNEALDERQRALEALARTVASSAEQISIAASGLHEIVEIAQKNLRQAEQLPHKLQEKIAEFQAQLSAAEDAEKEELERELLSLRTTESERLESVSQRIAKSSAEWARLETATQQHLTATTDALAKLSLGTAAAIGKAQVAAEQALGQARIEAARTVGEASGQGTRAIDTAKTAALAEFDAKLAAALDRFAGALTEKIAGAEKSVPRSDPTPSPTPESAPTPAATNAAAATDEAASVTAKRPRKPRHEESAVEPAPADSAPAASTSTAAAPTLAEPPPVPAEKIAEITPVAPHTSDPFKDHLANGSAVAVEPAPETATITESTRPPRKRGPVKKPETPAEPGLGLDIDQAPAASAAMAESVLTSDGATRLLVTAYIGIGNRLFLRGEGPGLSWEKGVPLQFVSIGKWRWETNDASAPVRFKLYKNDELECSVLGAQTLDPGRQQEVTAAF